MKVTTSRTNKKSGRLSLVLVMLLCAAMIGASCWFAYTQTAKDITIELDSVLDQLPAAAPETALTRPAASTTTRTAEAKNHPTEPQQQPTAAPATAPPETRPAAMIFAPSQPAETSTETITETIGLAESTKRWPVAGEIIQPYSGGELVKSATTGVWQTHNGIDLAGALGDEVFPIEGGIVKSIEDDALWGICVTIDHRNGYCSRYCGLNAGLTVTEGDTVTVNDAIGAIGDTADVESAMDTHLHFELVQGEKYVDPAAYLDAR